MIFEWKKKKAYILTTQLYLETDVLPPLNGTNEDRNMEQIGQENFCLDFELWKEYRKDWSFHIRGGEKDGKTTDDENLHCYASFKALPLHSPVHPNASSIHLTHTSIP